MNLRCEHPEAVALVRVLTLIGGSSALAAHLELDDCAMCRRLCRTEFVRRRVSAWNRGGNASNYRAVEHPEVFLAVKLGESEVTGRFSERHETHGGKLSMTLWTTPGAGRELHVRVVNRGSEYLGRRVQLEVVPPHGESLRPSGVLILTESPFGAACEGTLRFCEDLKRRTGPASLVDSDVLMEVELDE
jgi:hypothetical protein